MTALAANPNTEEDCEERSSNTALSNLNNGQSPQLVPPDQPYLPVGSSPHRHPHNYESEPMKETIVIVVMLLPTICVLLLGITFIVAYYVATVTLGDRALARQLPDYYWGNKEDTTTDGGTSEDDDTIEHIAITVDSSVVTDLNVRLQGELASGRLLPPLENSGSHYGVNSNFLHAVLSYWTTSYDWTRRQERLNEIPHFRTKIAGLGVHFRHALRRVVDPKTETTAILLIHGWPGGFVEMHKLIVNLLKEDMHFEVVAPSIPGFAFSEAPQKPGLGPAEAAQIFLKLMLRLGKERFYVHGSGWGSLVATSMATIYPQNVMGLHSTFCWSDHPRSLFKLSVSTLFRTITSKAKPSAVMKSFVSEVGNLHLQAARPDTVGLGLAFSPSSLTAYLLDKFAGWSNKSAGAEEDGGISDKFDVNELLDAVTILWISHSTTSSLRFFAEAFSRHQRDYGLQRVPITIPCGCLVPADDPLQIQSRNMVQDKYAKLIHYNVLREVGHFVALQRPEDLAKDLSAFVRKVMKIEPVVPVTDTVAKQEQQSIKLTTSTDRTEL